MKRIYTRTGDKGTTDIGGGLRVEKDDVRIEANGCIDELNSVLGIVRTMMKEDDELQPLLFNIQNTLMAMMSIVATPSDRRMDNPNVFDEGITLTCEREMDRMMNAMEDNSWFVLPGGTPLAAQLQFARAMARRAERRLWSLNREDELPQEVMQFMNRMSDLFFVMARYELHRSNIPEEKWRKFCYKRKS